jgi:1-acyl-sn-glycerol-3-phosphate acyltransferase
MSALRSTAFNVLFYGLTALLCIGLLWTLVLPRKVMMVVIRRYLKTVAWLERHILGLSYTVTGREHLPDGPFLLAAKHQSAWETMKLHLLLDDPAPVLKRELLWLPIWGWYAAKASVIPVNRGARSKAIAGMIAAAKKVRAEGRPIVIFPQGTRVAPGDWKPYRIGVYALYEALDLPVVPMALNSGVFWGRKAVTKRGGAITVAFLPPIPPGLGRAAFLSRLESELEAESDRLVRAVGGPATVRPEGAPGMGIPQPGRPAG